jgi:hypothetical protein
MSEGTLAPVFDFWIYNTMLIENEKGMHGTGFLTSMSWLKTERPEKRRPLSQYTLM